MRTLALALCLVACGRGAPPVASAAPEDAPRSFRVLAVNDVYRLLGMPDGSRGGVPRIRALRADLEADGDVLLLHAGDFLSPGMLARAYGGAQMVDLMNGLDGTPGAWDPHMVVTLGNHEFDRDDCEDAADLVARMDESEFTWVAANIQWGSREGSGCEALVRSAHLRPRALLEVGGVRVGVTGITTDAKHPDYVEAFEDPEDALRRETAALRAAGAELVIGLTHQGVGDDVEVMEALGDAGPDLYVGGHDHQRQLVEVDGRWLVKADADAVSAAVVRVVVPEAGAPTIVPAHRELDGTVPPDPTLQAAGEAWHARHAQAWCGERELPADCLDAPIGRTATDFVAEELQIRRFETSAGAWLAQLALDGVPTADVALLNSGGLRLNVDLPAGTTFTRSHVEELMPFGGDLAVIALDGARLLAMLEHSVEDWTGSGHYLQVAGLSFVHDTREEAVREVRVRRGDAWVALDPEATYRAVVSRYLVRPEIGDQDGYDMIGPDDVVADGGDLKEHLVQALRDAGDDGVRPTAPGHVCTTPPGACSR